MAPTCTLDIQKKINSFVLYYKDQNHQLPHELPLSHCSHLLDQTPGRQNKHSCIYQRPVKISSKNAYYSKSINMPKATDKLINNP